MSNIEDALDYALDKHTLLRSENGAGVQSASLALNKLLIDCLSRLTNKHKYDVGIDYHDVYLAMCAIFVALDRIKDCDRVCIESLRHTMAAFLEKVQKND